MNWCTQCYCQHHKKWLPHLDRDEKAISYMMECLIDKNSPFGPWSRFSKIRMKNFSSIFKKIPTFVLKYPGEIGSCRHFHPNGPKSKTNSLYPSIMSWYLCCEMMWTNWCKYCIVFNNDYASNLIVHHQFEEIHAACSIKYVKWILISFIRAVMAPVVTLPSCT